MSRQASIQKCRNHLERDEEFLIELPKEVQILRLLTSHGLTVPRHDESRQGRGTKSAIAVDE
jgi:hypothetical protein